jgi:hypothetical protein
MLEHNTNLAEEAKDLDFFPSMLKFSVIFLNMSAELDSLEQGASTFGPRVSYTMPS